MKKNGSYYRRVLSVHSFALMAYLLLRHIPLNHAGKKKKSVLIVYWLLYCILIDLVAWVIIFSPRCSS